MRQELQRRRPAAAVVLQGNRDPVKLTALLYLREALLAERYEECAEYIRVAREFGALPQEVRRVLENPKGALSFTGKK